MIGQILTLLGGTAAGLGIAYVALKPAAVAPGGNVVGTAAQDYWRLTEAEYQGIKNLMQRAAAQYQSLVRANGNRPPTVWMQTQGPAATVNTPANYVVQQGGNRAMYVALAPLYVSTNYGDFIDVAGFGRMFRSPGLEKSVERYVVETVIRNAGGPRQLAASTPAYSTTIRPALGYAQPVAQPTYTQPAPRPTYVAPATRQQPTYVEPARLLPRKF